MSRKTRLVVAMGVLTAMLWPSAVLASEPREGEVALLVPVGGSPVALQQDGLGARWKRVTVPATGDMATTLDQARVIHGEDVFVERFYALAAPGDEPDLGEQWYLENNGQTVYGEPGIPNADIDAKRAWDVAIGTGVLVAVVDSGVDASHPDLAGQVIQGQDFLDGDTNPAPEGSGFNEAHATMVAGIIAAADNDLGISGVAPGAKILNMRACEGGLCPSGAIANSIYAAVDSGADVINLSLGSPGDGDFPIEGAIDYARAHDVVVVAAAGNGDENGNGLNMDDLPGGEVMIPAGLPHPNILAIGASTNRDRIAQFSNWGPSLDLFAPGAGIYTTAGVGRPPYEAVDGTSFSTPVVAGVAALLLSHDPGIGYAEVIARLKAFSGHPAPLQGLGAEGRVNAARVLDNRFIDTASTVFHNTAKWLADQRITEGCNPPENHKYCPGDEVTRGQMAVFFARAFDLANTGKDYFDDDDGQFYENAANMMAQAGITAGCAPQRYCGDRHISRAEMAAMLSRALGLAPADADHFKDDGGSKFESAINKIAEAGITQGCNPPDNDEFCPDNNVNRGQMAAFLQRSVQFGP